MSVVSKPKQKPRCRSKLPNLVMRSFNIINILSRRRPNLTITNLNTNICNKGLSAWEMWLHNQCTNSWIMPKIDVLLFLLIARGAISVRKFTISQVHFKSYWSKLSWFYHVLDHRHQLTCRHWSRCSQEYPRGTCRFFCHSTPTLCDPTQDTWSNCHSKKPSNQHLLQLTSLFPKGNVPAFSMDSFLSTTTKVNHQFSPQNDFEFPTTMPYPA